MIFLRRLLAIVLSVAVFILFVVFVVLGRVNNTLGNPEFHIERLREADIYNFMYDDALPVALEEIDDFLDLDGTQIDITAVKAQIIPAVERVLPPEWVQARVEDVLTEIMPYMLGDTEGFSITVPLKGRVADLGETLKDVLHDEEVSEDLYEGFVDLAVELAPTYKLLKPHMDFLLYKVCFPCMCLTQEDIEEFENDPHEFVHKQNSPLADFYDPRMSAITLVQSVVKHRGKENMQPFLAFLTEILQTT